MVKMKCLCCDLRNLRSSHAAQECLNSVTHFTLGLIVSVQKWKTDSRKRQLETRIFTIDEVSRTHPETGVTGNFVVVDSPQWVNIIPVTESGHIVLVEQYRHGTDEVTLELPGGMIESGEDPREAGERECLEETGFGSSAEAELLGVADPNPAWLNNKCYMYVWRGCAKVAQQNLDMHEDIHVQLVPIKEVPALLLDGTIAHSLVLSAFLFYFFDLSKSNPVLRDGQDQALATHVSNDE